MFFIFAAQTCSPYCRDDEWWEKYIPIVDKKAIPKLHNLAEELDLKKSIFIRIQLRS